MGNIISLAPEQYKNSIVQNTQDNGNQNGWRELLPLISQELINSFDSFYVYMELIPSERIYWLKNNVTNLEWFNHLLFALLICTQDELDDTDGMLGGVNLFLKFSIPDYYPEIKKLIPSKVMKKVFLEISVARGASWSSSYLQIQLHASNYLEKITDQNIFETLQKFILPKLNIDKELSLLRSKATEEAEKKRKVRVAGILKEWEQIKIIVPSRYSWMKLLDAKYQELLAKVSLHQIELPQEIIMPNFNGQKGDLKFLVWNAYSWVVKHPEQISKRSIYNLKNQDKFSTNAMVQFLGEIPENDWFLEPIRLDIFQGLSQNNESIEYLRKNGFVQNFFNKGSLLHSNHNKGHLIKMAKKTCRGNNEDSNIIFSIEPLLIGATLGTFSFMTYSKTAVRVSELQQVCMNTECLSGLYLATFDDKTQSFTNCVDPRYLWNLFPKGKRKRYSGKVNSDTKRGKIKV